MPDRSKSTSVLNIEQFQNQIAAEYVPLFQLSRWTFKKTDNEYLSVVLLLQSGLRIYSTPAKFALCVAEGGNCLEVSLV